MFGFIRMLPFAAALSLGFGISGGKVQADLIFSENFNSVTGPDHFTDPNEEWSEGGPGIYLFPVNVPNWTLHGSQIYGFERAMSDPVDRAVMLNESGDTPNGISRFIAGLVPGSEHILSFEYWGDNRPFSYQFSFELEGITPLPIDILAPHSGKHSGTEDDPHVFRTFSFTFIPLQGTTTTTLKFTEKSVTEGSPIIDNVAINAVPEPSTLVVFVLGGAGLLFFGRTRARARMAGVE